jgi:hypothetical protein
MTQRILLGCIEQVSAIATWWTGLQRVVLSCSSTGEQVFAIAKFISSHGQNGEVSSVPYLLVWHWWVGVWRGGCCAVLRGIE